MSACEDSNTRAEYLQMVVQRRSERRARVARMRATMAAARAAGLTRRHALKAARLGLDEYLPTDDKAYDIASDARADEAAERSQR